MDSLQQARNETLNIMISQGQLVCKNYKKSYSGFYKSLNCHPPYDFTNAQIQCNNLKIQILRNLHSKSDIL